MTKEENETDQAAVATEAPAKAPEADNSELARVRREIDEAVKAKPRDETAETEDEEEEEEPTGDSEVQTVGEDASETPAVEDEAKEEGGPQGQDAEGKFTRRAPFSDALLERAIKAGVSMSEAREYPTETLLKSVVDRLEGFQKNATGETESADAKGKDGEASPADTDLDAAIDAIPDEWNKEEYDERIVGALLSLKAIAKAQAATVRSQAKELAEVRGRESQDFFSKQLESVKDFTKGDQTKVSAIRGEYDALKAGYAASGRDVSDAEVFKKAAQLVLGGDMQAEAKKNKAEAAGRRSSQVISRAAGQRVTSKTTDPFERVAEEINRKYFS